MRHVKGSHIVVPRVHPEEHAYILQNADNRIVFVIPYEQHYSLIGTTDVAVDAYAHPQISEDEVAYLLNLANAYLATPLTTSDIVWTYSGVRPLYDDGSSDPSAVTRDYVLKLDTGDDGKGAPVLSIFGGKITTYRKLAESALQQLQPFFPTMTPPWTRNEALPGGDLPKSDRRNGARAAFSLLCAAATPRCPTTCCAHSRAATARVRWTCWVMRRRRQTSVGISGARCPNARSNSWSATSGQ